jgi:hypothetical protein
MSTIVNLSGIATGVPEAASSHLLDAWSCIGLSANVDAITSDVATGESLEAVATITGGGADGSRLTVDGDDELTNATAGFHQPVNETDSMIIGVRVAITTTTALTQTILNCSDGSDDGWSIVQIGTTGRILGRFGNASADSAYFTAGDAGDNVERALTLMYDSSDNKFRVYVDGVFVADDTLAGLSVPTTPNKLSVARFSSFNNYLTGTLRDIQIYRISQSGVQTGDYTPAALAAWMYAHPYQHLPVSILP